MDDLVAFVRARLAEVKQTDAVAPEEPWVMVRAILALHEPVPFHGNNPPPPRDRTPENAVAWYCDCQCPDGVIEGEYPCMEARLLGAIWSDHPDYRDEWKP